MKTAWLGLLSLVLLMGCNSENTTPSFQFAGDIQNTGASFGVDVDLPTNDLNDVASSTRQPTPTRRPLEFTVATSTEFLEILRVTRRVLSIHVSGGSIDIDLDTGNVTIPDTLTVDEAAIAFWRALEQSYPSLFQSRNDPESEDLE